eukprot:gene11923-biopygen16898
MSAHKAAIRQMRCAPGLAGAGTCEAPPLWFEVPEGSWAPVPSGSRFRRGPGLRFRVRSGPGLRFCSGWSGSCPPVSGRQGQTGPGETRLLNSAETTKSIKGFQYFVRQVVL